MLIMTRHVLAFALLATTAGCPSEPRSTCEAGPPLSADAIVPYIELELEYCRFRERCQPDSLRRYHGGDVSACIAYQQCTGGAPESWTVTEACLQAVRATDCDGDIASLMYQSSLCAIGGPIPPAQFGQECRYSVCRGDNDVPATPVRCAEGLYCDRDDICRASIATGETCSIDYDRPGPKYDPCEPGAYCDFADGRCNAALAAGAECEIQTVPGTTSEIDPCGYPARCNGGVCTEPAPADPDELAAEGEACDDYLITCQHGLACVEPGVCTAVVCDGDIDAPCDGASCAEGLVCNSATERCEPPGEPCDDEERFCEPGLFCDDGTCQTERQSS
jgi:hypothetical protein